MTQGEALIHVAPPQRLLAPHVAKAPTDHRRRQMQPCPPRNETVGTWEPSWSSWESLKHFFLTSIMKKIRINVSVFQSDHIQLMSNVYIYIYTYDYMQKKIHCISIHGTAAARFKPLQQQILYSPAGICIKVAPAMRRKGTADLSTDAQLVLCPSIFS